MIPTSSAAGARVNSFRILPDEILEHIISYFGPRRGDDWRVGILALFSVEKHFGSTIKASDLNVARLKMGIARVEAAPAFSQSRADLYGRTLNNFLAKADSFGADDFNDALMHTLSLVAELPTATMRTDSLLKFCDCVAEQAKHRGLSEMEYARLLRLVISYECALSTPSKQEDLLISAGKTLTQPHRDWLLMMSRVDTKAAQTDMPKFVSAFADGLDRATKLPEEWMRKDFAMWVIVKVATECQVPAIGCRIIRLAHTLAEGRLPVLLLLLNTAGGVPSKSDIAGHRTAWLQGLLPVLLKACEKLDGVGKLLVAYQLLALIISTKPARMLPEIGLKVIRFYLSLPDGLPKDVFSRVLASNLICFLNIGLLINDANGKNDVVSILERGGRASLEENSYITMKAIYKLIIQLPELDQKKLLPLYLWQLTRDRDWLCVDKTEDCDPDYLRQHLLDSVRELKSASLPVDSSSEGPAESLLEKEERQMCARLQELESILRAPGQLSFAGNAADSD